MRRSGAPVSSCYSGLLLINSGIVNLGGFPVMQSSNSQRSNFVTVLAWVFIEFTGGIDKIGS